MNYYKLEITLQNVKNFRFFLSNWELISNELLHTGDKHYRIWKNIESSFYHIKGSFLLNYHMQEINLTICEKQVE